jgi:hypothetical protein
MFRSIVSLYHGRGQQSQRNIPHNENVQIIQKQKLAIVDT